MRQTDRLIINVLSNYGLTLVAGVTSLVVVPVVVNDINRGGFGLAMMLLSTFTVMTTLGTAVNRAMQRYLPQDMASSESERVNSTFNSSMLMYGVLGVGVAVTVLLLRGWYLDDPAIDPELRADGSIAFYVVAGLILIEGPLLAFQAGLESIQRFDLVGAYSSATTVLRMIAVIVLFKLGYGSVLVFVASQILAVMAASLCFARSLRRALPGLSISLRFVNKATLKSLFVFTAAGLLVTSGNVLGLEGFRVLVGKGLGLQDVGGLSAVWTFRSMVFMIICSMTNVLTPTASSLDARGSMESLSKLLVSSTKYASVAAASTCLVPLAVTGAFLKLWLGDEFGNLQSLMLVILIAQVPIAASASAQQILIGLGRMRVTGPAVFARGAGSLCAAWIYLYASAEPTLVGAAFWLYVTQVGCSLILFCYGGRHTGVGVFRLLMDGVALPVVLGSVAALLTWAISSQIGVGGWAELAAAVGIGEAVFLGLILAFGLGEEERAHLGAFLGRVRTRLLPSRIGQ